MDLITSLSNELEQLLERFDHVNEASQAHGLQDAEIKGFQTQQMSLMMTDIPRARARLRVERERAGKIRKAFAVTPQLDLTGSDEAGWVCTLETYMIEGDIFFNSGVQGKGIFPKDARTDFRVAWRDLCKHRHGRVLELREIGQVEYRQKMKDSQ